MKQKPPVKTREEVRAEFERLGISVAAWARANKFNRSLVYMVLSGAENRTCRRGQSHKIAVLLGLKAGVVTDRADAVNAVRAVRPASRGAAA